MGSCCSHEKEDEELADLVAIVSSNKNLSKEVKNDFIAGLKKEHREDMERREKVSKILREQLKNEDKEVQELFGFGVEGKEDKTKEIEEQKKVKEMMRGKFLEEFGAIAEAFAKLAK
ncbi:unnamed protein product [Moneuplotes crassus]|uniref:Uncharacterized protein n=1 Tax=Euplotes crassus TaxID=5936 RepID=A0AAD2D7B4_EUPCR|nr:unnamed protein product [Moneuplotes crassus]